ncbi:MAG: AI-2E family transporter [Bacteroidales bacterium]|nr:AI-2E family transporter [Bacteroidales bacterium]
MENRERYTDKLAKYILAAAGLAIICALCWYFRNVLAYILAAVVVSLIAKPLMKAMQKISIKGRKAPDWLLAAFSIVVVLGTLISLVTSAVPIISSIVKDISMVNIESAARGISVPLSEINEFLRHCLPQLGSDFKIEITVLNELQNIFDVSMFSSVLGSAASFLTSLGIGLFSVVFIGFFFIKDDGLFTSIICSLVPDRHEKTTEKAISDIGYLLSRYFIGVLLEIAGVALINFLGLLLIARLGFNAAIGIAVLTGIFNVIPYVGPLLGGALGTVLGIVLKYTSISPIGLDVNFWAFTAILIAIFSFTQLVDNFLYQPVIYSTSIKSTPLEIFIVLLIVGHIGGPLAMIIAIPCYTAVRVIAFRFFGHIKAIRRLIPSERLITNDKES